MKKKTSAKKKIVQPKSSLFKFNNTINLSIMIVIIILVSIVELVMFIYSRDSIKGIQIKLPTDIIGSLAYFNHLPEGKDALSVRIPAIQKKLNEILPVQYKIADIVVTNQQNQEVYKTGDVNYHYRIKDDPSSFQLKPSVKYRDPGNFRSLYIKKEYFPLDKVEDKGYYNIYLVVSSDIVSQSNNKYLNDITQFVKIFFSMILLISIIIAFMLARSISKPLSTMEETISRISKGDLSGRLEYTKYYEINQLVQSYNMMVNALQRLYSTLEAQVQDRTKELKNAYAELQNTQAMMVHSEKMKSLGELVAGIMHEINNPINFIYGNMTHLSNYSNDLIQIIEEYTKYDVSLTPEEKEDIDKLKQDIDYEFLKSDLPDLIKSCKEGADRAKNIIQDLKSFSRMEEVAITDVDIPHEIDTTLNILHNKIKNKAEVHKEYMENVPRIEAFGGQLNQVFMNIIDNAVGAIKDHGDIWIRINTDKEHKNLIIEIEDNGIGMDEETTRKVFNPFFTTKPVGQGTGLGLSITYKIIKNHQGDINVESRQGMGTKFIITLPINIDRENLNASMLSGGTNGQI